MELEDRPTLDVLQADVPYSLSSCVAVGNPLLIVNEDNPLFHSVENRF
jgi:hypothetical protein